MVKTYCSYDIRFITLEEECKNINELPIRHRPDKRSVIRQTPQHTAPLLVICHEKALYRLVKFIAIWLHNLSTSRKTYDRRTALPDGNLYRQSWLAHGNYAPAHDVNTVLPQLKKRFAQETQWYEIGWGDKGFYQSQEITIALTLQAMFWSSGAVMHIVAFSGQPERYFAGSEIKSLLLHTNQRNSLMRYLGRSFARDAEGNLIPLKQGIYGDSQFYAANGRYGILNTCNKWTAKGLESAGLTINPSLKLTAGSVMKAITDHRMCLNKYCYP